MRINVIRNLTFLPVGIDEGKRDTITIFYEFPSIMELDNSILMQKQVRDNSEDLRSEFLDLKNWEEQMKRKEQEILSEREGGQVLSQIENDEK